MWKQIGDPVNLRSPFFLGNEMILDRIDAALERMKARGHDTHPSYEILRQKKDSIAAGSKYECFDVTKHCLGAIGAAIVTINYKFIDGKNVEVYNKSYKKFNLQKCINEWNEHSPSQ